MATTDVDSRLRELKSAWSRLETENDSILATAPVNDGVLTIDNDRRRAFQKNVADMTEIKGLISDLEAQSGLKAWASGAAGSVAAAHAAGAAARPQFKSLGAAFAESDEFKSFMANGGIKGGYMNSPWAVPGIDLGGQAKSLGGLEVKDVYTASPTGDIATGFAPITREAMVPRPFRRMRVRDLFPVQNTSSSVIEYFRVTGFVGNSSASVVPERSGGVFAAAPQTSLSFTSHQSVVRNIQHWEAIHRTTLADTPALQGVIDNELLYGLRLREDDQILNGTGTSEDLLGLMVDPDAQTYSRPGTPAANENKADDIRRAATKVILSYYEPTGVVMHPNDWEDIELLKDSTGAYVLAVAVAMGAEQKLWRLPIVDTPAMTEGRFLVGSFGLGAKLYDRLEGSIRVAEQHSDYFLRNAVVVMAEERIGMTIPRPEAFVKGTFGA